MFKIIFLISFLLLAGCDEESSNTEELGQDVSLAQKKDLHPNEESGKAVETKSITNGSDNPIIRDKEMALVPQEISIPAIDVQTKIEKVGKLENGQMGVPSDFNEVGWFEPGTKPGDRGNSVMAGHVDSKTGPAVFFKLKELKEGDEVVVTGQDGKELIFIVVKKEAYPYKDAPVSDIFGYTSRRMLNLITCTGTFDRSQGTHIERLVVYTELKKES